MQQLKNIAIGFLVSFIGSIPLGYLNVVGFEVYQKKGLRETILYLLGVVLIEAIVIYLTLIFVAQLTQNKKLSKFIEGFSVLFMLVLAYVFYAGATAQTNFSISFQYASFVLGLSLSCFNFMQLPFWTGWNLYLLNGNYIEVSGFRKYAYVSGTAGGTFCGMLVLILSLHYFASRVDFLAKYLMQFIIPAVFLGLGIFQAIKFWQKYKA